MTNPDIMADAPPLPVSDQDIYEAMREIPGYLDITPGNFKDLYKLVYRHTLQRIAESVKAIDIMTTTVVTVQPDTSVQEAADLMAVRRYPGFRLLIQPGI